jgi:hypothetical protein
MRVRQESCAKEMLEQTKRSALLFVAFPCLCVHLTHIMGRKIRKTACNAMRKAKADQADQAVPPPLSLGPGALVSGSASRLSSSDAGGRCKCPW